MKLLHLLAALSILTSPLLAGVNVTVVATPKAAAARQDDQLSPRAGSSSGIRVRVVDGLPTAKTTPAVPPAAFAPQPLVDDTPATAAEPAFTPEVRLYSASWCQQCPRQKQILDRAGIRYETHDGNRVSGGIPQVWISTKSGDWRRFIGVVNAESIQAEIDRQQSAGLEPGQQPTDASEVTRILKLLSPRPHETLVDYGCGDGRFLIAAARHYGCRAVGVEIDPQRAQAAREAVAAAGLSDRIRIIEGDATQVDVDADVGVVYLWPDVLQQLKPKLQKLDRFVSYMHPVQGLAMSERDGAWIWRNGQALTTSTSRAAQQPRSAVWRGRQYAAPVCNDPRCAMCRSIRAQLAGSR